MNDLRSEIRAAFQKEQAANPPPGDLRRSTVGIVAARPRRRADLQWMAVAAAIVIGALIVVSLMSTRAAQRGVPSHPRPSPVADYGPPPAGVPLFYLQDPRHDGWYVGFDWTGKPRGTIKLAEPLGVNGQLVQSPDGATFAVAPLGKGRYDQFLDRLGNPLPGDSAVQYQSQVWADDGAHLCALDHANGAYRIGLRAPGAAPRWATLSDLNPPATVGVYALALAGCSARNDTAVIDWVYEGTGSEAWVVRISDGKTLLHQTYPAGEVASIVASPDCTLLAASSSKSIGYLAGPTAPTTTVVQRSDGATLLKVDPSIQVLAISPDNRTVLLATTPWASGVPTHLMLLDIPAGNVLWRYDGDEELATFLANPTGSGFAVMLKPTGRPDLHPNVDVLLIAPDGTATNLPSGYLRP